MPASLSAPGLSRSVSFWLGSSGGPTPSQGLPSAASALRRAGALPRKNRRLFACRPRLPPRPSSGGPTPRGLERVAYLNPIRILANVSLASSLGGGDPYPAIPLGQAGGRRSSLLRARSSLLRARCVVTSLLPCPALAAARFSVPPCYLGPGALPRSAQGGLLPGSRHFLSSRLLGRGPLPRFPRSLCSARSARSAF